MELRHEVRHRSPVLTAHERASPPRARAPDDGAGALLRQWRVARRLSQLDLALEANVSARHLSYLETGRSHPSREMILRLAEVLEIPLRERNALLVAAGYAPRYVETGLAAPELAHMRNAIDLILRHQEPYPAFVLDPRWNILLANDSALRCTRFLLGGDTTESNMIRLLLGPDGLRSVLASWEQTARSLLRHLHDHLAACPTDDAAGALLAETLAYPGIPRDWQAREVGGAPEPLLTAVFRKNDTELRFFSTITTFGTPRNVTLEELHIECSFPADDATARACRELFAAEAPPGPPGSKGIVDWRVDVEDARPTPTSP